MIAGGLPARRSGGLELLGEHEDSVESVHADLEEAPQVKDALKEQAELIFELAEEVYRHPQWGEDCPLRNGGSVVDPQHIAADFIGTVSA